jgi:hypothetical protein
MLACCIVQQSAPISAFILYIATGMSNPFEGLGTQDCLALYLASSCVPDNYLYPDVQVSAEFGSEPWSESFSGDSTSGLNRLPID